MTARFYAPHGVFLPRQYLYFAGYLECIFDVGSKMWFCGVQ